MMKNKRVLVLLIGGRLTPNFISVLALQPNEVVCLVSEDEQDKFKTVQEVLSPSANVTVNSEPVVVPAFDLQQTIERCLGIVDSFPDAEVVFNVTGATKIMAIGAYEVAKRRNCRAVYVNTANGQILDLIPPEAISFPIQIKLSDYLSFYNREPSCTFDFNSLSISQDQALQVCDYLAHTKYGAEAIDLLRRNNRGRGKRTITIKLKSSLSSELWKVLERLNEFGILKQLKKKSETEFSYQIACNEDWNFLNGTWLEVYVWHQAKTLPLFDDCQFSFEIIGTDGVRKELDVGCIYQGQLIHCSCKSEKKPFKTSHLDELSAVSHLLGGNFCTRLFVTNVRTPSEEDKNTWESYQRFLQQANDRKIVVVTGDELPHIAEKLSQEAKKPTFWRV